jgi:hypothetical protein
MLNSSGDWKSSGPSLFLQSNINVPLQSQSLQLASLCPHRGLCPPGPKSHQKVSFRKTDGLSSHRLPGKLNSSKKPLFPASHPPCGPEWRRVGRPFLCSPNLQASPWGPSMCAAAHRSRMSSRTGLGGRPLG